MDEKFLRMLDEARKVSGIPFIISSGGGFRCKPYNRSLAGGARLSSHMTGLAADIMAVNDEMRSHVFRGLITVGIQRLYIYPRHIHADIDYDKPFPRVGIRQYPTS